MAYAQFKMATYFNDKSNRPVIKNMEKIKKLDYVPIAAIMGTMDYTVLYY
jgi:hypothetical protein